MCAGPLGEAVEIGLFQYGCPYFSLSNHFLFVRLPEVYGDEELRTFFDAITGDPLKVVYEILLMTGLRERGRSISPGPASISTGESCGFGRIRSMDSK